jgi:hypothetical protein
MFGAAARSADAAARGPYLVLESIVYAACGTLLFLAGSKDRRAISLGIVFLLSGSAFSSRLVPVVESGPQFLRLYLDLLYSIQLVSLIPAFFWLFASDFPRAVVLGRSQRLFRHASTLSTIVGIALCLINIVLGPNFNMWGSSPSSWLRLFSYGGRQTLLYWPVVYALLLPVFPAVIWRTRSAPVDERRRVSIFALGLALIAGPALLLGFLQVLIPAVRQFLANETHRLWQFRIGYVLLAVSPVAATYSVFVHRVLDVRLIVRKAIQYALARYTVLTAAAVPMVALLLFVYEHQDESVSSLFVGSRTIFLVGTTVAGVAAYRFREVVLREIDRRFFREQYDAHRILIMLVEKTRVASSSYELTDLLKHELERALHPSTVVIPLLDAERAVLRTRDGACRPLSLTSSLAGLVETEGHALNVLAADPNSAFSRMDAETQEWIADQEFAFVVPITAAGGNLLGLIALGEKKSELPYSEEDRSLLSSVAVSAAIVVQLHLMQETPGMPTAVQNEELSHSHGLYCPTCKRVEPPGDLTCPVCRLEMHEAPLPCVLAGKFRVERQIGSGGMGIVFRAIDLTLRRRVAIKTLPRLSTMAAVRLRREAQAIAGVEHPKLAMIFGAETWRGTPALILEFLEGGTLADRLKTGVLPYDQALAVSVAIAEALEYIHGVGMLHRDIKPSNIGFAKNQVPKLMDFGLARIFGWQEWEQHNRREYEIDDPAKTLTAPFDQSRKTVLAGTPLYLSPEVARGMEPSPQNDIWALSMVLLESVTGRHPLAQYAGTDLMHRIRECRLPRIDELLTDYPPSLTNFLAGALSRNTSHRPASARDFREHLETLQKEYATTQRS